MARSLFLPLIFVFCISSDLFAQATVSAEGVATVLAEHKQARDLIQNLRCQLTYSTSFASPNGPESYRYVGEYWHSRDAIRLKVSEGLKSYEFVWKDGVRTYLQTRNADGQIQQAATKAGFSSRYMDRCDVWARSQMVINYPESSRWLPLEDLLKSATKMEKAWSISEGQRTLTTIRLLFSPNTEISQEWRIEVVLDTDINNLIRKVTHYVGSSPETSQYRREEEVTAVAEVKRGMFIPKEIKGRSGVGVILDGSDNTAVLSRIQVDQTFTPTTFVLKLPNGINLVDSTKGVAYTVDPNGKPTSKPMALGQNPPPDLAVGVRSDQITSETEESSRTSTYILVCAGFIFVAAGVMIFRRIRAR